MKKIILTVCSALLLCSILFNMSGCLTVGAVDLMDGITPHNPTLTDGVNYSSVEVSDFAVRLLRSTDDGANTFISPMSVMLAFAMTANGAAGNTKAEMEQVLGMSVNELNEYLYGYISSLPESERCKLAVANSIWFVDDDRLTVNNSFLQKNGDYYEIIAGERRFRASKLAGLTEIPVIVLEADDLAAAKFALIENLQREDLNVVEEALGYKSLIEKFNMTQEEVEALLLEEEFAQAGQVKRQQKEVMIKLRKLYYH